MKWLHILPSVDPRGGGPMEGVRQLGTLAQAQGHSVEVLSLDAPGDDHVGKFGLPVHAIGPSHFGYRYNTRLVSWLREHARNYDAIIVNGLWQYHGFGAWRALRSLDVPYFVFTHGMLDPWFKKAYPLKHLKKWLYWPWAEYRLLRDASAVLFTCEEERLLARESFWLYKVREYVVTYGTRTPPQDGERLRAAFLQRYPDLADKRCLLFLSRIHEKKGCDLLIRAFATFAVADPSLRLVIAGPDQTNLVPALRAIAEQLGIADRIVWPGMLQGDLKWGAFYTAEAFVLPSHQENFGIAVAEALGCGLPVLISNKVNIWREIEADGAGLVGDDTEADTRVVLQRWSDMSAAQRHAMGTAARDCFNRRFTVEQMAASLLQAVQQKVRV